MPQGQKGITIESGVDEAEQISSFQNATLQSIGENLAVSIATFVEVPDDIAQDPARLETYLHGLLSASVHATQGQLNYEVQIGPASGS